MFDVEASKFLVRRQRKEILEHVKRIAVVGLKADPIYKSYGQTKKLIEYGLNVVPVIAECPEVLGLSCYDQLLNIPGSIDMVQIYPDSNIDWVALARQSVRKGVKAFWIENAKAPQAVRKILSDGKIYLVENESLAAEYRRHCLEDPTSPPSTKAKAALHVSERMTRYPVTVTPRETLESAIEKMKSGHFRHLPVVDDRHHLVGILSDRDIRLVCPSSDYTSYESVMEQFKKAPVARAAVFSPVSVLHDATLEKAASLMLRWEIGALPVIAEDTRLVGILTNVDFLKEFVAREKDRVDQA